MHQRTMTLAPHESTNMPYAHARCAPPGVVGSAAAGPVEVLPGSCAQVCPGQRKEETSGSLVALCPPGLQCRPVQTADSALVPTDVCPRGIGQWPCGVAVMRYADTHPHPQHGLDTRIGTLPVTTLQTKPAQPSRCLCHVCAPPTSLPCKLLRQRVD